MIPKEEQKLIDAVLGGDRGALGQLLSLYQHRLYNVVLRMVGHSDDAAELTQEAMLKIIEHIDQFKGNSSL